MQSRLTALGAAAATALLLACADTAQAQSDPAGGRHDLPPKAATTGSGTTTTAITVTAASATTQETAIAASSPTASASASAFTSTAESEGPPTGWFGPPPGWSGGVQAGGVRMPAFEGSRSARNQPLVGAIFSYRNPSLGSIELGSRGLQWTFRLDRRLSLAAGLTVDPGRGDDDRQRLTWVGRRPGSERLAGLGDIAVTPLLGFNASGMLRPWSTSDPGLAVDTATSLAGLQWTATVRRATSGHRGMLVDGGIALPWTIGRHARFSFGPSITWADRRYTQAYFGITPEQSRSSGRPIFEAGAGTKRLQWTLDMGMALSRHWSVIAMLQAGRLQGDAARSPITERRHQTGGLLATRYQFQL